MQASVPAAELLAAGGLLDSVEEGGSTSSSDSAADVDRGSDGGTDTDAALGSRPGKVTISVKRAEEDAKNASGTAFRPRKTGEKRESPFSKARRTSVSQLAALRRTQESQYDKDGKPKPRGTMSMAETRQILINAKRQALLAAAASQEEISGRRTTNASVRMSELRRVSNISNWAIKAKPTLEEFSEAVKDNQQTLVGGVLSDYLHRLLVSAASRGGCGAKDQETLLKVMSISKVSPQKDEGESEVFNGYDYAASMISRERLHWCLTHPMTRESKSRGRCDVVKVQRWRYWANSFRKMKKQVVLIRAEVRNFLLSYNLLHHHVKDYQEPFLERKERLDKFWTVYHERGGMIQERTRVKTLCGLKLDDLEEDVESEGTTSPESSLSLQATNPGRGMVSLPKYGVTFEFGKRQRWKVVEPSRNTMSSFSPQRRGRKGDSDSASLSPPLPELSQGSPSPPRDVKAQTASGAFGHHRGKRRGHTAGNGQRSTEKGMGEKKATSLPNLSKDKGSKRVGAVLGAAVLSGGAEVQRLPPLPGALPPVNKELEDGKFRYLEECDLQQKLPIQLDFTTGRTTRLEAPGRDLVDTDLLPLMSMLQAHHVEVVSLQNNSLLTDKSLVPFLRELSQRVTKLHQLNLSHCRGAGALTLESTIFLLKGASNLQKLDLSRIPIGMQLQIRLCSAIGGHAGLNAVSLADTGLNNEYITQKCIEMLFASRTIHTLDLSWNCLTAHNFLILGERLAANQVVRSLSIANCSAAVGPVQDTTPISCFLEFLAYDEDLKHLDISMNRIDYRCALILEDCLEHHKMLHEINLSQNPLGRDGLRNVLRLLARDKTGLVGFDTEGCYVDCGDRESVDSQMFRATNPGRSYQLNLNKPYHRSLLRMLYKAMEKFGLKPEEAFRDVKYSKMPYEHAKKSQDVWQVLKSGVLKFTFCIEPAIEARMTGISDWDFQEFLKRYFEMVRLQPGWKKVTPLFARWQQLDGRLAEQRTYVGSISADFDLTLPYLEYICVASPTFLNEAVWRLWNCIPNDKASQYTIMMLFPKFTDLLWTHQRLSRLLEFNVMNPTGHYCLNLENCADHALAERLLLLDRWELTVDLRNGRVDISQWGNNSHVRNETYQKRSLHKLCENIAHWSLPDSGELELDYVSSQRPKIEIDANIQIMSNELWESLLGSMYDSPCAPADKIAVLRAISHQFCILSMHLRQLMGYFRNQEDRAEAFVIFYPRIVDMHNTKVFRVRFENPKEVQSLRDRLGHAAFFPFMQPENQKFDLDLSFYDQRLCVAMLMQLARREKVKNIIDPEFFHPDGTKDDQIFFSGIPPIWVNPKVVPKKGRFTCTYVCSPEDRKFAFRKQLAETYGYIRSDLEEGNVMWWTGLLEVPEDALEFLEFLICAGACKDVQEVFTYIDGVDGNGVISLREFEDGLRNMGCEKFANPKDPKAESLRINALFRWLDTGGEGTISKDEFAVLGQLWKEFELSVTEFVHFLRLTFGTDDLWSAWEILDDDGSGEISAEEWVHAVTDIGYWGPSEVVFSLLDTTDDGVISFDEFQELEKYQRANGATWCFDEGC